MSEGGRGGGREGGITDRGSPNKLISKEKDRSLDCSKRQVNTSSCVY